MTTQSDLVYRYGAMIPFFGSNSTDELPTPGQRLLQEDGIVWYRNDTDFGTYIFFDNSPGGGIDTISIFTERTISGTYECESHEVLGIVNGSSAYIKVANIGQVFVSLQLQYSTTFFNNNNTGIQCADEGLRCSVIEVLEMSTTQPWYYKCFMTLGTTQNDPDGLSFVSDNMARYATASIASGGYVGEVDNNPSVLQSAQIIPQSSYFGSPLGGDKDLMARNIAFYTLGAIAVAGIYNPSQFHNGQTPSEGQQLTIGHHINFYGILALILIFQALFIVIVAVWANKVKVTKDSHLGMAVMMRPIANRLDDISNGRETKAFKKAKKNIKVKYEKDPITALWSFKMKN